MNAYIDVHASSGLHARIQWPGQSPENHKNIGLLSNTEKIQATRPVFKVWPLSASQRNMLFLTFITYRLS